MAKRQTQTNRKNTVIAVKRIIGRKFDSPEVAQARHLLPYELVRAANGDVHIQIGDTVYAPAEISAFVLKKLKSAAEDYLGQRVEKAVLTVPAYFNDAQRQATRDAGRIAGFGAIRIINEPTAAALAYGLKWSGKSGQFAAVYDLGGGTFDITILEVAQGLFKVRATAGDNFLGGEDFDQRIIDWLITGFQRETGIDLGRDGKALQRLKEAAEKTKCELSTTTHAEITLPFISADASESKHLQAVFTGRRHEELTEAGSTKCDSSTTGWAEFALPSASTDASGSMHLEAVLTRRWYEELTDDLLDRTIEPCKRCLADALLRPEQLAEVLLVGGQTRSPKVREVVRQVFGREPRQIPNPDEAVAMGAAIQAGITNGEMTIHES